MTWSLFYRYENGWPIRFHELRQFDNSLWASHGNLTAIDRLDTPRVIGRHKRWLEP